MDAMANKPVGELVEELARQRISQSQSCANCLRYVSFHYADGVLTIQGRLPSFYMKQVLQTLLKNIDGVERIDNQTDVVSA